MDERLLPLAQVQTLFRLEGKLTGVGVQTDPERAADAEALRERYHAEAELQVVSLSSRGGSAASDGRHEGRRRSLGCGPRALAGAVLVNTSLLRVIADHSRFTALHAIGLPRTSPWPRQRWRVCSRRRRNLDRTANRRRRGAERLAARGLPALHSRRDAGRDSPRGRWNGAPRRPRAVPDHEPRSCVPTQEPG